MVLLHDRPVIPPILRQEVLEHLHSDHAGGRFLRKILPFTVQQTLTNHYNNQLMPFQKMPTEYEEQCKSLSPVVPYKMDKAKGHWIEDTTEVDSADDGVPPSTPSTLDLNLWSPRVPRLPWRPVV